MMRAERRRGELLHGIEKKKGGNPNLWRGATGSPLTLQELGIERTQSHRWQTVATLPEEELEQYLAETTENHEELTTAAVYQLAQEKEKDGQWCAEYPPSSLAVKVNT